MKATPEPRRYTNGRVRLRPEQIDYLDSLLHKAWVETSRVRALLKERDTNDIDELIRLANRELRLITSIQEEVARTREEIDSR